MGHTHRRRYGLLVAWIASVALLQAGNAAHAAQEQIPQSIIDGAVSAVCQKQIVLLGELPSHGEARGFEAKSKIASQLIAQCGFSAVLFEAGVYDFVGFERALKAGSATQDQLDNAIGRFWLTRELAAWRRDLFESATQQRLTVGGLDDQGSITAHYARATLPELVAASSSETTATACRQTVARHLDWTYDAQHPFDEREQSALQGCARNAAGAGAANQALDAEDRVMLDSFARYASRQGASSAPDRDESMFLNLAWYLERMPANSRVIVWTATVHAARQRGSLAEVPLGARTVERWGDKVGAIGFTAYAGYTSRAGQPSSPIPAAPADSLEAVSTSDSAWAVLDSEKLRALGRVPSRLLGEFVSDSWSDYFDLVVVIRQEAAPTFDPWK